MSTVLKYGVGAVVVGALAVAGNQINEKQRAEAIERYGLNEASVQTMDFCTSSMSSHNVEFASKVDEKIGCACIASEFSKSFSSDQLPVATNILGISHKYGGDDSDPLKFAESMMELQSTSGMNEIRFERTVSATIAALSLCAQHETHLTEEQRTAAAEEKQAFYESQRAIMDKAVQEGLMTREDADRRLARMKP